jgi:hypothetical protein
MKAILQEKIKPQREPSKLSQYEYHPPNEETYSPKRLTFQEYPTIPSIPIFDDQNQIQEILQQEVLDKIENTENPLHTLDDMLTKTKIAVQELTVVVNNGEEVEDRLQEAIQEEKAISEVIDIIEDKLEIKEDEKTPLL